MIDHALQFAERGWQVLPVRNVTQRPLLRGWPKTASSQSDQIHTWWNRWPEASVGVLAGSRSSLAILDVEAEYLESFTASYDVPDTLRVISGGGGVHYYFAHEESFRKRSLPGIGDLQGDGSYVVAPPSLHDSGNLYAFAPGHGFTTPLAPMPAWLLTLQN